MLTDLTIWNEIDTPIGDDLIACCPTSLCDSCSLALHAHCAELTLHCGTAEQASGMIHELHHYL